MKSDVLQLSKQQSDHVAINPEKHYSITGAAATQMDYKSL